MKHARWLLIIAAIYLAGFFAHALTLQKTVYGDGIFYYSWVRSIVVDRDINFTNEYRHFGVSAPATPKGAFGNKHPIGAPLFWLPWYAQAHAIIRGSGYELPYQLLVGLISVLAALTGLVLLYRLLLSFFSRTTSMLAITAIALTTNLFFYGSLDPVNSHAISFFAAVVFLSFLFSKKTHPFLTGCTLGFCTLVRPQDAALGILSFARPGLAKLKSSIAFFLGALFAFSPQLFAWYALYGTPWTSPYLAGSESFTWWPPHFLDVLFSPRNGLVLWTPIVFLALVGFIFWKSSLRRLFLLFIFTEIAIIGSWSIWWQGASYSGRMFVSVLPILSFGLAALFQRLQKHGLKSRDILIILVGPLTVLNMLFIFFYLFTR
ncbi:MAG: hypothetical protein AAB457_02470 [Patescibacteria group bacterium]